MKTTFKRNTDLQVSIAFDNMTQEEALALCHILAMSPFCDNLANLIQQESKNAADQDYTNQRENKSDADYELFKALT